MGTNVEALEMAVAELEERATVLAAEAEEAHQTWKDSKGAAGTFDAWTAAITRHNEATSAVYYTKAVIAQLEAEAATPAARLEYLSCFDDYALESMAAGGKWNDFTGKLETATRAEVDAVYAYRKESSEDWEATTWANELVGEVDPVVSDTVSVPLYSLLVAGKKSEHGTGVTKWGIAYAAVRELQRAGIDPEFNTGIISAVLDTLENNTSVIAGGLETGIELSTMFEANN